MKASPPMGDIGPCGRRWTPGTEPPAFDDQDDDTDGVQNEVTTREVAENTKAVAADDVADVADDMNDNVGAAVTANDPDPNE